MTPISYLVGWDVSGGMIRDERQQLIEEGRDPEWIAQRMAREVSDDASLWAELNQAPPAKDFPFHEPSDLAGIRAARKDGIRRWPMSYSNEVLCSRMLGAWLGRCCGCALGKPVEGFFKPLNGLSSRGRIKTYLQAISPLEYPLNDYFPLHSPAEDRTGILWSPASCRENVAFMESDDDIRYTVLGQKILLEKGPGFTTLDVIRMWIDNLPYVQVCTAEAQAYRNYIMRYHVRMGGEAEVDWNWVATHQNPYREWIGAQIRADSFGYAAPGNPELAAEFAWRDARMSHVKNGIYGEMFVAAMIAAAFALKDPLAVVEAGLAEIPESSRLTRDVRETIAICQRHNFDAAKFEIVFDEIEALLGYYHPVHTNNNAGVVVAALLLGGADFEKAITLAVMAGWDTDCNGATVGSIFGAMHGAEKIPAKWESPLHDTLESAVIGYHPIAISECAARSVAIAKKLAVL